MRGFRRPSDPCAAPRSADGEGCHAVHSSASLTDLRGRAGTGLGSRFDLTSNVGPTVGWGDFDGDGLLDVAVAIVDQGGRRRGIAIVHRMDQSVHIVGAGQPVGDGTDDLARETTWSVTRLRSHRDGIRVVTPWHGSGWLVSDGRAYEWLADSR
jgi:hypothetical protein